MLNLFGICQEMVSSIAGSYVRLILSFSKILYGDFQSGCTNMDTHSSGKKVLFYHNLASIYCQLLFLILVILSWYDEISTLL